MAMSHDLCIGPSMFGDGGMQSLLKIELSVLASDKSGPASIFFRHGCLVKFSFVSYDL